MKLAPAWGFSVPGREIGSRTNFPGLALILCSVPKDAKMRIESCQSSTYASDRHDANALLGYFCSHPVYPSKGTSAVLSSKFGVDRGRYNLCAQRRQTVQILQMYSPTGPSPCMKRDEAEPS